MKITLSTSIQGKDHDACPFAHTISSEAEASADEPLPQHLCHVIRDLMNVQLRAVEDAFNVSFESAVKAKSQFDAEAIAAQKHIESLMNGGE
jgi:hypothetical protein